MSASDPFLGQVLNGTYRVLRPISRGGMGLVYEAENVRLRNVRYAVKVLLPKWVEDREHLDTNYARFRRAAEIASALRHPNIVTIVDYNKTEKGYPYLVMELLEGEDLDVRLKREGTLPTEEVCTILSQVGSALQLAHHCGIVHRDLKPGNIFLCGTPGGAVAKLLDFGISKEVETRQRVTLQEMVLIGTPAYMSPEQARGDILAVDHTSDIFALATIAYRCLTGTRAFDGRSDSDIRYQVCYFEPTPISGLLPDAPPELEQVLRRAHAKKKEERYQLVSEMLRDFLHAFGREAPPALDPLDVAKTIPIDLNILAQVRALQAGSDLSITQAPGAEETQPTVEDRRGDSPAPGVAAPRAETTAPVASRSRLWLLVAAIALAGAAIFAATLFIGERAPSSHGAGSVAVTRKTTTPDRGPAAAAHPPSADAGTGGHAVAAGRDVIVDAGAAAAAADAARPIRRAARKSTVVHTPQPRPPRPATPPPAKKPGKKQLIYDDV